MKYETSKYIYDFQNFQTIRFVGDTIYNGTIAISEADQKENSFLIIFWNLIIKLDQDQK